LSNGSNVHVDDVVDLHQLLDKERLAVLHPDHFAIVTRKLVHFVFEAIDGQEDVRFLELLGGFALLGMELGGESQDGTAPLLIMRRDVDDESGPNGEARPRWAAA
jgi:hypothetical protein